MDNGYFEMFPNPVSEDLTITLSHPVIPNSNARITLYDMQGKQVRRINLNAGQSTIQINVSDLLEGMYQVEVYDGTHVTAKQIICQ